MFGIGTSEILVILLIALLVIGPSKLPEIARALGKALAEFRRVSTDVKRQIDLEVQLADLEKKKEDGLVKEKVAKQGDDISQGQGEGIEADREGEKAEVVEEEKVNKQEAKG